MLAGQFAKRGHLLFMVEIYPSSMLTGYHMLDISSFFQ